MTGVEPLATRETGVTERLPADGVAVTVFAPDELLSVTEKEDVPPFLRTETEVGDTEMVHAGRGVGLGVGFGFGVGFGLALLFELLFELVLLFELPLVLPVPPLAFALALEFAFAAELMLLMLMFGT